MSLAGGLAAADCGLHWTVPADKLFVEILYCLKAASGSASLTFLNSWFSGQWSLYPTWNNIHGIGCIDLLNQYHIYPNSPARKTSAVRCVVHFNTPKPQIYSKAGLVCIRVLWCCKMEQVSLHYSSEAYSDFLPFSWRSDTNHLSPKHRNRIWKTLKNINVLF